MYYCLHTINFNAFVFKGGGYFCFWNGSIARKKSAGGFVCASNDETVPSRHSLARGEKGWQKRYDGTCPSI